MAYAYDHFGRLVEKREGDAVITYEYNAYGQRTARAVADGKGEAVDEKRTYDRYGRLAEISSFGKSVKYAYDAKGRVSRQTVDGTPIDYAYTKYGQLAGKYLGGREKPDAAVEYEYSKSGKLVARTANGIRQSYEYDGRGQLLAVKNEDGSDAERYAYDKAGNMVKKMILRAGRAVSTKPPQPDDYLTTTFTFDGANQLVSSTTDGVTTKYAYDAAGRLVKEGLKTYCYGYLDKVLSVTENDKTYTYTYHVDGQLARATYVSGGSQSPATESEDFLWDGLALVKRGSERFINEPHIGGGNPVVSSRGTSYFNDMLGTTLGAKTKGRKYSAAALTAFGEPTDGGLNSNNSTLSTLNSQLFFTGKPHVEGLGHAFLFRNYRAGLAKWQTADPLGYPDGWNQLGYGMNRPCEGFDLRGGAWTTADFVLYYYELWKPRDIDTDDIGYTEAIWSVIASIVNPRLNQQITNEVLLRLFDIAPISSGSGMFVYETDRAYANFVQVHWVLAGGRVQTHSIVNYSWRDEERHGTLYRTYSITRNTYYYYSDSFSDPLAFNETVGIPFEVGFPYMYSHAWDKSYSWNGEYVLE